MNVIIVKLGAIGDIVQCAASVSEYKKRNPAKRITWIVGKIAEPLLRGFEVADEIISIDETNLLNGKILNRLFSLIRLALTLRRRIGSVELIFTAYSDWRYKLITCLVRSNSRISLGGTGRRALIQHRNRVYEYYRFLCGESGQSIDIPDLLNGLGGRLRTAISDDRAYRTFSLKKSEYVLLVPGGAKNILRSDAVRRWPINNYIELSRLLLKKGYQVAIAGGAGDKWVCDAFSGLDVVDCIGKTNLLQMWDLIDCAAVIVAHDSGPAHLAAMTNVPIVALFGPTPPNTFLPYGRKDTTIIHMGNRISCSPCYDGRDYAECDAPVCMEGISVDTVLHAVNSYVHARGKFCV